MTIENFDEKFRDAKGNLIELYSDPHIIWGYKLRLEVDLNRLGDEGATHMSVHVGVMDNGNDKTKFNQTLSFILIHQDDQSKCIRRTIERTEIDTSMFFSKFTGRRRFGITRFISLKELHDGGFIKNNTLYIRCIVE